MNPAAAAAAGLLGQRRPILAHALARARRDRRHRPQAASVSEPCVLSCEYWEPPNPKAQRRVVEGICGSPVDSSSISPGAPTQRLPHAPVCCSDSSSGDRIARGSLELIQVSGDRTEPESTAKPEKRTKAQRQSWRHRVIQHQRSSYDHTSDDAGNVPRGVVSNEICPQVLRRIRAISAGGSAKSVAPS